MNAILLGLLCLCLLSVYSQMVDNFNNTNDVVSVRSSEVLSRRKRFIIFPEGSSLQLVFCLTFPTIFAIGDIFLYGYTAALAYELPQDPYSPFMHHGDPLHRRVDTKAIYYMDYYGKVLFKRQYQRKPIVNPAFAKRSVDARSGSAPLKKGTQRKFKIDRKQMHASKHKREFLKSEHMEGSSVEFHRSSRASLYGKVETMLQGLGGNGKQCMLKTLCLVGQTQNYPQGTFFQEILRAVFTLPKSSSEDLKNKEYDEAHLATESCDTLYPECGETLSDPSAPAFSY